MAVVVSGGELVATDRLEPMSSPWSWDGPGSHPYREFFRSANYGQMYREHPSVFTVVSKLAELQSMLPLKTYRQRSGDRQAAGTSVFGQLVAKPSSRMSAFDWRMWMASTWQINGITFALKVRNRAGRLVELAPVHPTRVRCGPAMGSPSRPLSALATEEEERSPDVRWWYRTNSGAEIHLWRRELLVWSSFNPDSMHWGLSKLEPLRDALESDGAAQAAIEALWKQGGKPSFVLSMPGNFGNAPNAAKRLADQWQQRHGGVAKWHKPLVLEEGLTPHPLSIDDNLQYLDVRKLTDAQVAKVYKLNPAALGDLERATFNNITEILRDVGRSTLPPVLKSLESAIDFDVRDGRHGGDGPPEFPSSYYVEHELDGIMRGDYEARADAHNKSILMGWQTPAEVRELENRGFIEGSDRLFMNGAMVPVEALTSDTSLGDAADRDGAPALPDPRPNGDARLSTTDFSTVMGRLSRPATPADINFSDLVAGLEARSVAVVAFALAGAGTVPEIRQRLKDLNQ